MFGKKNVLTSLLTYAIVAEVVPEGKTPFHLETLVLSTDSESAQNAFEKSIAKDKVFKRYTVKVVQVRVNAQLVKKVDKSNFDMDREKMDEVINNLEDNDKE